ncbi:hypothetical protein [Solicola gregarius]|uniref:NUDIX hydrolase n=1 Tax=Solicola gregarius TaxID=2908642 RepID=A0AA46TG89_9ACTN|nr:hypothetical protein [Solicola gregarius]UYM04794.1 hypothetical protein L0C25_20015 [Solicola gregarius]
MTVLSWVLIAILVVGLVAVFLSWTAGRLDRMHIRLTTAHASLDRQLIDRSSTVRDFAVSGLVDPAATLVLVEAADNARAAPGDEREDSEGELSRLLRTVLGPADAAGDVWERADAPHRELLADLVASCERVRYAHRFHNDLVERTQAMRRRPVVRLCRLAGRAPWPQPFEFDDAPPDGLTRLVGQAASGRAA